MAFFENKKNTGKKEVLMDTKKTIAFLQKRKEQKQFTKGIRVFINTFEYDVSKSRARTNKFCEEKEVKEVHGTGIEVRDLAPKYNSSEMIRDYYSGSKTISLTKKEALAEYKRMIETKEIELEEVVTKKRKMLKKHLEKAGKEINGKGITKKKKNN